MDSGGIGDVTQKKTTVARQEETIAYVHNKQGPTLGYSKASGVSILEQDGFYFKDLNRSGTLDKYEDWRLPAEERAKDLASKMSIEQIAGLMLYSRHQAIPAASGGWFASTYDGKPYEESGAKPWDLTDEQIKFLTEDHVRHILVTSVESPETAARWSNAVQAFAEGTGLGIPANNSSDPRHSSDSSSEFNAGAGGAISMWPEPLGLAAAFDPELVRRFGEIAAKEYRALGIATALSPQIDIATDPRWFRFNGTFGEDSRLATDMGRAYIDGFQSSADDAEIADGWGYDSVNAMVKHWPGGGSGEGGRDAHYACGKYAVYPGNNFEEHLKPFTEGAFRLDGPTKMASAVMPYYTISTDQDTVNGENVGNSYNTYLIRDLLRGQYGYDGVVCTDWLITADESGGKDSFLSGKPWGVEELSVAERHYKLMMAGVDQFGGNNEVQPVLEAYRMGVAELGEEAMRKRFEQSAVRLLANMFRLGLFENPYLDAEASARVVGNPNYMQAGYEAQLKSIVMLKNKSGVLPLKPGSTVYIPQRYTPPGKDWFGNPTPETLEYPLNLEIAANYFKVTDNPDEADFALVCMRSPKSGTGFSQEDADNGGNGYVPISLQYKPYTAVQARKQSLARDVREGDAQNRSYYGKTVTTHNEADLDALLDTAERMKGKPVIVSLLLSTPAVVAEFETAADGILAHFGVQDQAILDVLTGASVPSGLLPMQMPANMETVEAQLEDAAHDMECHADSENHRYDFGFGLNWSGVIQDSRTEKYKKDRSE
ncbi:glycoside hydrolase family 3 protein [Paenibacillus thiaminolyticus]|uniref:beta-glucosidase n=1 Tax=Paenibacillus thiaminolyticus TaxID=49283 RepID=A0AAP9DRH5_PANTH|nr:glycoside hydrolase family 3 N-terminal domain-containing protein [Paenibacillus thiaminolyticus]MCY9537306.1 glycoside hydrolase family 3 protein [Paenibacillus thiaminolyticus]MCY9603650.1 glycoside hydrolase family 3 protein [Paenibacillus thiaminolyticus]MCY9606738.1 glycoside hydrolase family 3 protein [Paenibacillus thiaminolyticus]MCY9612816.1 glycoside hydrolase family 3 protein [Paenibacillus thiaminolyticus]MCY9619694.1 glycoside hydrolase family 3 protein [Paenibacillus thiaminol